MRGKERARRRAPHSPTAIGVEVRRALWAGSTTPTLRKGSYFPSVCEPHEAAEKALVAAIQKPTCTASRRAPLSTWCSPWAGGRCRSGE